MDPKRENQLYAGICVLAMLACLATLAWTITEGLYKDIDGLLLILIALSLGGVFQIVLLMIAKSEGWLDNLPVIGQKKTAGNSADSPKPPAADAK
jgi:hypothetical protein